MNTSISVILLDQATKCKTKCRLCEKALNKGDGILTKTKQDVYMPFCELVCVVDYINQPVVKPNNNSIF